MSLIKKNIKFTVTILLLFAASGVFIFDSSLFASEPDSLSFKIEEPTQDTYPSLNDSNNLSTVSFSEQGKVSEVKKNDLSGGNNIAPKQSNQNEENMQDSYTRNSTLRSTLSIIYKLLQYFL